MGTKGSQALPDRTSGRVPLLPSGPDGVRRRSIARGLATIAAHPGLGTGGRTLIEGRRAVEQGKLLFEYESDRHFDKKRRR